VLVLSLFFSFFVHIRSPLKCEENDREQKKEETEKKAANKEEKETRKGNLRLIKVASKEKRER